MRKDSRYQSFDARVAMDDQDAAEEDTSNRSAEREDPQLPPMPQLLSDFIAAQSVTYQSPHEYARDQARQFVGQHLLDDSDPDQLLIATLYINSLDAAPQRANVAHCMTLSDALMGNWQQSGNGEWLEHLGHLRDYRRAGYPVTVSTSPLALADCFAYEAIYRKTSPQRFDASTQVAIDPVSFKRFVWEADLQAHYQTTLTGFWDAHGADYHLLIKAALLKSAYIQHSEGSLSAEDKALVLQAVGLPADQDWETLTLDAFRDAPLSSTITFRELVIYRYVATDILLIRHEGSDRIVMYVPGNSSPLHAFDDQHALCDWVALQCRDPRRSRALESHFSAKDDADGLFLSGVKTTLAGLAAYPHRLNDATGHWYPRQEISLGVSLSPWPFSHVRRSLQSRLATDGLQLIRNRGDYNKEIASLALSNAIVATGAIAMVVPALWVPLAAMSLALIGLGVDEALEGRTLEEKQTGAGRIVFGVLNAVPALIERAAVVGSAWGAAARAGDEIIPGSADEVGQMISGQTAEQHSTALANQQDADALHAEEAQEQAGESASERQLRLESEEEQRQALTVQHEITHPSVAAFGVEPEGLRALTPEQRTTLAGFEYTAALDRSGQWTIDDIGAVYKVGTPGAEPTRFVRVHAKMYRVERVEAGKSYRIVAPDDLSHKGPYVRRLKGFYSDIDLKPGLRGGDSYIDLSPPPEPLPEIVKDDITLVRAQPPVAIEMPMDGIEVREGEDGWGQPAQKYFAMDVPGGTPVSYDADIACWRKNAIELIWRDNKGKWKIGSEKAYLKVRPRIRRGVLSEIYRFPRLPGFPSNPSAVQLTVHQIWLGSKSLRAGLIDTIKANMQLDPALKFILHVDIDNAGFTGELAKLQGEFADYPNMTISELRDESFFPGFLSDQQTAVPYGYFRNGDGQNLAAASDVLRYRLIEEYGGIYLDCDDVLKSPLTGATLEAGKDDVLVGAPVTSPRMGFFGPNNSHFASHADNPVLREVQKKLYARFITEYDTLAELSGARANMVGEVNPYMSKISEVTGPRIFLDTLKNARPDYAGILDQQLRPKAGINSLPYMERLEHVQDFYAPFARRLRISAGRENSWVTPAG